MTSTATPTALGDMVRADIAALTAGSTDALSVAVDRDGRVLLDGVVHSLQRHAAALHTAQATPGVLMVEDLIEIRL